MRSKLFKSFYVFVFSILISCVSSSTENITDSNAQNQQEEITGPARDVIRRLIGSKADAIILETISSENDNDTYEVEARDGLLTSKIEPYDDPVTKAGELVNEFRNN